MLGDRVRIESLAIQDGRIIVGLIGHGPGDGACCPTQEQTLAFQLTGDTLEGVPLTLQQLKNAEYQSEFPTGGKARLTDGAFFEPYEPGSASGVRLTLSEHVAFGDLNGDGAADAAVILTSVVGAVAPSGTWLPSSTRGASRGTPPQPSSVIVSGSSPWRLRRADCRAADRPRAGRPALLPDSESDGRAFQWSAARLEEVPSIVDVLWHWERFEDTRGPSWDIAVADPQKYTLRLLPDGTFQVKADCNNGSGTYTLAGEQHYPDAGASHPGRVPAGVALQHLPDPARRGSDLRPARGQAGP